MSGHNDDDRTIMGAPVADDSNLTAAAMMHLLVLEQPGAPPHRLPLGPEPLTIGRKVQNGLMLASDQISRRHCIVALENGVAVVTDTDSTNGCWIGGQRIEGPTHLPPGSVLRVGPYHLQYLCLPRQEMERNRGLERDLDDEGIGGRGLRLMRKMARSMGYERTPDVRNRLSLVVA